MAAQKKRGAEGVQSEAKKTKTVTKGKASSRPLMNTPVPDTPAKSPKQQLTKSSAKSKPQLATKTSAPASTKVSKKSKPKQPEPESEEEDEESDDGVEITMDDDEASSEPEEDDEELSELEDADIDAGLGEMEEDDEAATPSDTEEPVADESALLEGIDSSEGEDSSDEEALGDDANGEDAFKQNQPLVLLRPEVREALEKEKEAQLSKKERKKARKAAGEKEVPSTPGTVYLGRVPHGFYEKEMRAYFSQFGEVTNLRLSRNKKTGASKHFGFIQFTSQEVAKIVAETMDNYLMFGHLLKCKYVPEDKLHPDTWKGANKKFRVIPHNKIQREKHNKTKTPEQHTKLVDKLVKSESKKRKKLEELGIEYDFAGYEGKEVPAESADTGAESGEKDAKRRKTDGKKGKKGGEEKAVEKVVEAPKKKKDGKAEKVPAAPAAKAPAKAAANGKAATPAKSPAKSPAAAAKGGKAPPVLGVKEGGKMKGKAGKKSK
ncbi:MKI67 FHA domain-interacting nucleolar phosphoprotein [Rhizophlyctis rosea]|uniref:MKI67 FHA domain-interacting nucleolar phosphoprotein n=1 Tax=Rhizophlyctis rosea TaxID=64517 RepID=A0AAD5X4K2_9FUNG|nr:MKI67 FHA domain-interacting nucleolar phosphoprotein [Rhizophlyctis rosea]